MKWGLVGASTIAAQHMIAAIRAQGPGQVKWLVSGAEKRGSSYTATEGRPRSMRLFTNKHPFLQRIMADSSGEN